MLLGHLAVVHIKCRMCDFTSDGFAEKTSTHRFEVTYEGSIVREKWPITKTFQTIRLFFPTYLRISYVNIFTEINKDSHL